jgi:cysteine desulfurase
MGAPLPEAGSAIRVSLGWTSTAEEADRFVDAWAEIHGRLAAGRSRRAMA